METVREIQFNNAPNITLFSTLPSYVEYPNDGYIKLTSTAYKRMASANPLPGREYYSIRGIAEWVKKPMIYAYDILAIGTQGVVDNNYRAFGMVSLTGVCSCGRNHTVSIKGYVNDCPNGISVYNPIGGSGLAVKAYIGEETGGIASGHVFGKEAIPKNFTAYYGLPLRAM